tara:strand:+ start:1280 stop:2008 length:729 start_codon:yes stop_codon:yes gene_type:complete
MSIDQVLDEIKVVQDLIEDEKEHLQNGLYVRLCAAMQKVYNRAHALKPSGNESGEDEDDDAEEEGEEEEEESESNEEPERERTEDDMGLNELAELWGWNFDFGRPGATLELEGLIWTIVEDFEPKRVCAAVRVLNGALKGSKPGDPADAERILEWKQELFEQRAIEECAVILEGKREFQNSDEDPWMYSVLCDEILELFQRLGEGDALYRTKLRRGGALKGLKKYQGGSHLREAVLDMLQQR